MSASIGVSPMRWPAVAMKNQMNMSNELKSVNSAQLKTTKMATLFSWIVFSAHRTLPLWISIAPSNPSPVFGGDGDRHNKVVGKMMDLFYFTIHLQQIPSHSFF